MQKFLIVLSIFFIVCYISNNALFFINHAKRESFNQGQLITSIGTQKILPFFNNPNIPQKQSTINFNAVNIIPIYLPSVESNTEPNTESNTKSNTESNTKSNTEPNTESNNTNKPLFINTDSQINKDVVGLNILANKSQIETNNSANIFDNYGPAELIYTNKEDNKTSKYYRRKKLNNNSIIYYIETNNSVVFYNLEDLKLPNIDALKLDNTIISQRNLGINIIPNRLTIYGYNNKIYLTDYNYNYFQPFLLNFRTLLSPNQMKNKIYNIFGINYQLNAYINTIQEDTKKYNQYVIYLRPTECDKLIKSFEDNIIVIPLLQELKINMNGITLSTYNTYELNESLLCMRVGSFISNNPDDIIKFNNELINFVIDSKKIKNENIYYNLLLVEGITWDSINNFMNKLSTYNFVFHISLHIIQHYNQL